MMFDIVYVGDLRDGKTSLHRFNALKGLGYIAEGVSTAAPPPKCYLDAILRRVMHRLGIPPDNCGANRRIMRLAETRAFQILWLDKAITVSPETLAFVRKRQHNVLIVGYSPDNMCVRHNQTRQFLRQLPHYDCFFTTKSFNVLELKQLGCERVVFVENAFEPSIHKPVKVTDGEVLKLGGAVGFVGSYEQDRAELLLHLARNGIRVRIWGNDWERCVPHRNLKLEAGPLWDSEYAKAICCFDINLCFLRKANFDLQTTRSIEIPACGGFMLAERSIEHERLFREGREAEFFSDKEELLQKIRYYLNHPGPRQAIGRAGRERCLASGYSNPARCRAMLQHLDAIGLT